MPGVCAFGKLAATDYGWPPKLEEATGPNVERKGTSYRLDFEKVLKPLRWDESNQLKHSWEFGAFTAVLTVGKKLSEQLDSLAASTHKPAEIWVCMFATPLIENLQGEVTHPQKDFRRAVESFKALQPTIRVHTIVSGFDFKYFGRFQLAMQASTKYVAFFDEDQIPGPTSLELLIDATKQHQNEHNKPAIFGVAASEECKGSKSALVPRRFLQRGHWFVPRQLLHAMFSVPFKQIDMQTLSSAVLHLYGAETFEVCPVQQSDEFQLDQQNSQRTAALYLKVHKHLQALQQVARCSGDTVTSCKHTQNPPFVAHPLQTYIGALQSAAQLQCEQLDSSVDENEALAASAEKLSLLEQQTDDSRFKIALKIGCVCCCMRHRACLRLCSSGP